MAPVAYIGVLVSDSFSLNSYRVRDPSKSTVYDYGEPTFDESATPAWWKEPQHGEEDVHVDFPGLQQASSLSSPAMQDKADNASHAAQIPDAPAPGATPSSDNASVSGVVAAPWAVPPSDAVLAPRAVPAPAPAPATTAVSV